MYMMLTQVNEFAMHAYCTNAVHMQADSQLLQCATRKQRCLKGSVPVGIVYMLE